MGLEHLTAVWEGTRQSGSGLVVLLAVASYCDPGGKWIVDQATLQRRARIGRRRIQQVLDNLVEAGELAVTPGDGRGHPSVYRLLIAIPERAKQSAPFPAAKGATECTLSQKKGEAECALSPAKGEAGCTLSPTKGAAECTLSAPLDPPFPPDPQIPLYPPEKADMESFALAPRPLTGPQSATFRTNLLLEEAGVPLPSPAQIGVWVRTLGGVEPLLDLLRRLIQAGLATKKTPAAYIHRVVMERAERTEPARPLDARAGREMLRAAGADEARWIQAQEIMANVEKI